MYKFIILVFLTLLCGCVSPLQAQIQPAMTPMSCKLEGEIIKVLPLIKSNKKSVCAKYPCKARVRIMHVLGCGSSVSRHLNKGDIVDIEFAYTLHNTARLFPGMKTQYPGLKRGAKFIANAEQRMEVNSTPYFVIYAYEVR